MDRNIITMNGIAAMTIHAPCLNFVYVTTTSTTNVAVAPIPLMTMERRQPRAALGPLRFSFSQCRTIPVCDSVNDVNTPTTYNWISRVRSASNTTISRQASAGRTTTPVSAVEPEEKARRMTNSPMGPATLASSAAGAIGSADGQPPRHRKSPTPIIVTIDAMKAYVGNANSVPDSRTPRRLARVISRTNPIESSMRNGRSSVTADVKANTPATTETETVRT